jgi:hypothetical protein
MAVDVDGDEIMNNNKKYCMSEVANDELTSVFKELLTIGNNINSTCDNRSSLLIGKNIKNACQETINFDLIKSILLKLPVSDVSPDVRVFNHDSMSAVRTIRSNSSSR